MYSDCFLPSTIFIHPVNSNEAISIHDLLLKITRIE